MTTSPTPTVVTTLGRAASASTGPVGRVREGCRAGRGGTGVRDDGELHLLHARDRRSSRLAWPGSQCTHAPPILAPRSVVLRELVAASGVEPWPVGYRASIEPCLVVGNARRSPPLLWPSGRRVLPGFLTPVHREVHQRVAVVHRLDAAVVRPVGLEHLIAVAQQVTHEMNWPAWRPTRSVSSVVCAEYQGTFQSMKSR